MLGNQLRMLGNIARIEVGDAQVEQNVEDIAETEEGIIESVGLVADGVLHPYLYAENPEGFDQQVGQQHPEQTRQ